MKYRMSEGMTNIGTPLKEAMERTPRPNTPLGLPLFWDAPAPRPDGSLINEGTKKPEQEPVSQDRDLHSHMMVVASRAVDAVTKNGRTFTPLTTFTRAICKAIQADKNLLAKLAPQPKEPEQAPDASDVLREVTSLLEDAVNDHIEGGNEPSEWLDFSQAAIAKARIIQPQRKPMTDGSLINEGTKKPEQEPVAKVINGKAHFFDEDVLLDETLLYTYPLQRKPEHEPVALLYALEQAREWIGASPHGDNCFLHDDGEYNRCFCGKDSIENYIDGVLENTTPPQRTWVGLTDDEREAIANATIRIHGQDWAYATAIEAKLKEKNT